MSVLDGPGEGTWSVFAMKAVEERDQLRVRVVELEAQLADIKAAASKMAPNVPAVVQTTTSTGKRRGRPPKGELAVTISLTTKVTADERRAFGEAAQKLECTESSLLRRLVLTMLEAEKAKSED